MSAELLNLGLPPSKFFKFKEDRGWSGTQPVVGFAAKEIVSALVSEEEMSAVFGGHLEYEDQGGGQRYLGVWGDRKVGRFLRLLRERGARLEIEEASPKQFRQRHRASR